MLMVITALTMRTITIARRNISRGTVREIILSLLEALSGATTTVSTSIRDVKIALSGVAVMGIVLKLKLQSLEMSIDKETFYHIGIVHNGSNRIWVVVTKPTTITEDVKGRRMNRLRLIITIIILPARHVMINGLCQSLPIPRIIIIHRRMQEEGKFISIRQIITITTRRSRPQEDHRMTIHKEVNDTIIGIIRRCLLKAITDGIMTPGTEAESTRKMPKIINSTRLTGSMIMPGAIITKRNQW
jgi:hypothetical protein